MFYRKQSVIAFALIAYLTASSPSRFLEANPSSEDPHKPFVLHDKQYDKLHEDAARIYSTERKRLTELLELHQEDRLRVDQGTMRKLGQANIELFQLKWLALRLQYVGEPAGFDFEKRCAALKKQLDPIIVYMRKHPDAQAIIAKIETSFGRNSKRRMQDALRIQDRVNAEQWEEAEAHLHKSVLGIRVGSCFLDPGDQDKILLPYGKAESAITQTLEKLRRDAANAQLLERLAATEPKFQELLDNLSDAQEQIKTTGTARIAGKEWTGPDFMGYIAGQWRELQLRSHRWRGLEWARCFVVNDPVTPELTDFRQTQADFSRRIVKAIAGIIVADAGRATEANAAVLYEKYLPAVAPLVAKSHGDALLTDCERALAGLTEKSPSLANDVHYYQIGTSELIRWRERTAAAAMTGRASEFRQLGRLLRDRMGRTDDFRGFSSGAEGRDVASLVMSGPETMLAINKRMLQQNAAVGPIVLTKKSSFGQYQARTYTTQPIFKQTPEFILNSVQRDLMIDEDNAPYSLAGAAAYYRATKGGPTAIFGKLEQAHLEALVTRFVKLPDSAWEISPLGQLPQEYVGSAASQSHASSGAKPESLQQMVVRFSIQPLWVQYGPIVVSIDELQPATQ